MLQLVPFAPERHLTERYVAWLNDPVVVRYSEQRHRIHTLASCGAYAASIAAPDKFWAIELDGDHIGNITTTVDGRNDCADLAIMIGERNVWGLGHGLEAWMLAKKLAGASIITAGTMTVNAPMRALFAKSGMREVGCTSGRFLWEGHRVGLVHAQGTP